MEDTALLNLPSQKSWFKYQKMCLLELAVAKLTFSDFGHDELTKEKKMFTSFCILIIFHLE